MLRIDWKIQKHINYINRHLKYFFIADKTGIYKMYRFGNENNIHCTGVGVFMLDNTRNSICLYQVDVNANNQGFASILDFVGFHFLKLEKVNVFR